MNSMLRHFDPMKANPALVFILQFLITFPNKHEKDVLYWSAYIYFQMLDFYSIGGQNFLISFSIIIH